MGRNGNSKIAALKHRIALCRMEDVVTQDGEMHLTRKDVFHAWARIEAKQGSAFSPAGYSVDEPRTTKTHEIYIRYRSDMEISAMAWIFEERLKSSPRWFKILKVSDYMEDGQWWCFKCRIVERSDDVTEPAANDTTSIAQSTLPPGVRF